MTCLWSEKRYALVLILPWYLASQRTFLLQISVQTKVTLPKLELSSVREMFALDLTPDSF